MNANGTDDDDNDDNGDWMGRDGLGCIEPFARATNTDKQASKTGNKERTHYIVLSLAFLSPPQ